MITRPVVRTIIANHRVLSGPRIVAIHNGQPKQTTSMLASARWVVLATIVSVAMWVILLKLVF